jgi:hypothetical protein
MLGAAGWSSPADDGPSGGPERRARGGARAAAQVPPVLRGARVAPSGAGLPPAWAGLSSGAAPRPGGGRTPAAAGARRALRRRVRDARASPPWWRDRRAPAGPRCGGRADGAPSRGGPGAGCAVARPLPRPAAGRRDPRHGGATGCGVLSQLEGPRLAPRPRQRWPPTSSRSWPTCCSTQHPGSSSFGGWAPPWRRPPGRSTRSSIG